MAVDDVQLPRPMVGCGFIVIKDGTHILLHQRKSSHGVGSWGCGGGHLENGESFEQCALREKSEEMGDDVVIGPLKYLGVCNLTDFLPKHYVDIGFAAEYISGVPQNNEPTKKTDWQWYPLNALPEPLFPSMQYYIDAYLNKNTYFYDAA